MLLTKRLKAISFDFRCKMAIDKQIYYWAHMLDEAFHIGESNNRSVAASKRMNNARQAKYDEYYTSYENAPKLLLPFK